MPTDQRIRKWTEEFLLEMSTKTDPYAEKLVQDIIKDKGFEELRVLFRSLNDNDDKNDNVEVPLAIKEYFNKETTLPNWADEHKIKVAQEVFLKYGPEISLLLNYKSLPLCYVSKNGAKVLALSGRLVAHGDNTTKLARRLLETAQMVINVMAPGGFDPQGKGIITVKKVRLYHAAIRTFIKSPHSNRLGWDITTDGEPINQEEMAGTQMAFSALIIKGLENLGIDLSKEEKDAYIHCWNIVGHFIGVDPSLYPQTYEEGWELGVAIIKRNCKKSDDGELLTSSLIEFSKNFLPGKMFDGLPVHFINLFIQDVGKVIGQDINHVLNIPKKNDRLLRFVIGFIDATNVLTRWNNFLGRRFPRFNVLLLQGMISFHLKTNNVEFYIPPSLKSNWKL